MANVHKFFVVIIKHLYKYIYSFYFVSKLDRAVHIKLCCAHVHNTIIYVAIDFHTKYTNVHNARAHVFRSIEEERVC